MPTKDPALNPAMQAAEAVQALARAFEALEDPEADPDLDTRLLIEACKRLMLKALDRMTAPIGRKQRADLARVHGAFERPREIPDADTLLVLLLFYTHGNASLRLTAWFALVAFNIRIKDQSLGDRFRNCSQWVRALLAARFVAALGLNAPLGTRLRIQDGSVVCRAGATGAEFRIHFSYEPSAGGTASVEVTDAKGPEGAEGLDQVRLEARVLAMGDRNYGRYAEFQTAKEQGVDLLVRVYLPTQPLLDATGQKRTAQEWTDAADQGQYDHQVQVTRKGDPPLPARLITVPMPEEAANRARQKVREKARKKGKTPNAETMHQAGYLTLLTTLDVEAVSVAAACALYRVRWQIECFIKRAKSVAELGLIRGGDLLARAQIWARLLSICSLELERPPEGAELPSRSKKTERPRTLWRWLQALRLVWLGPLAMLAALGARTVSAQAQDDCLRERSRKRGLRSLLEEYPCLTPATR